MIKEEFVQKTLELYFTDMGYECTHEKQGIDLIATHSEKGVWKIEAKGETTSPRVDFCTCVGQLIGRIDDPSYKYGIALPETQQYIRQVKYLTLYVRERLNIHILFVSENEDIRIIPPNHVL